MIVKPTYLYHIYSCTANFMNINICENKNIFMIFKSCGEFATYFAGKNFMFQTQLVLWFSKDVKNIYRRTKWNPRVKYLSLYNLTGLSVTTLPGNQSYSLLIGKYLSLTMSIKLAASKIVVGS